MRFQIIYGENLSCAGLQSSGLIQTIRARGTALGILPVQLTSEYHRVSKSAFWLKRVTDEGLNSQLLLEKVLLENGKEEDDGRFCLLLN